MSLERASPGWIGEDRKGISATNALRWWWGLVLAFSLLALMRDQIAAAARAGLKAATINSTNVEEWQSVLADVRAGRVDVLLISPERLANPSFAARLTPSDDAREFRSGNFSDNLV